MLAGTGRFPVNKITVVISSTRGKKGHSDSGAAQARLWQLNPSADQ